MNWYRSTTEEVLAETKSDPAGLSSNEAGKRLQQFGRNELQEAKKKSMAAIFLLQFKDVMILILLAAAVISGIIGDLTDGIVILIIVILNAIIGFFQEYRAEKAMEALKQMAVVQAAVLRDGNQTTVPASELVPGDCIVLEAGNAVPADVRIMESNSLRIEEAALTGESQAVDKIIDRLEKDNIPLGDQLNLAFKGTFVATGRGKGIVYATGMNTELGRIANMLQQSESMTPLQLRMASFGKRLSGIILLLCLLFFLSGWLRGEDLLKMTLTSISLAVAAIPEALPAVITISLALAAKRMIRLNCLVRKLPAVETLGSVTYICTDKTGTLTRNKMHVEEVLLLEKTYKTDELGALKDDEHGVLLLQAFALNNDAKEDESKKLSGDSTEIALLEIAKPYVDIAAWPRKAEIPFDPERKLMTTFHEHEGKIISFTKGAPDVLLAHCQTDKTDLLLKQIDEMAARGYRVMGFAFRHWDNMPDQPKAETYETGLQFLGLAGIIDPPREEVFEAIAQCRGAGLVPVMITGDHPLTARNIAERIGILNNKQDLVLSGQELTETSPEKFKEIVENVKVYARVSPEQKLQIITSLQDKGHFVAMTGDGVNDAPSLKKANIGIAMGITGTDVSKEAAHIVLLDDNFTTIVKAIREGRRIYDNILKFIKFLMTTNTSEILTLLVGPLIGLPVALLPIHILWINLVSDGLPAISLSFEGAEKDIMNRPPRPPQQSVFAGGRGAHMIWVGMTMAGLALSLQGWAIQHNMPWQTMIFNFMCLSQMAHVLAIRSERQSFFHTGLLSNQWLIWSVVLTFILQLSITYIPLLQSVFKTESLSINEIVIVCGASALVFVIVEIEKLVIRRKIKLKT